jgi:hypothetical protein
MALNTEQMAAKYGSGVAAIHVLALDSIVNAARKLHVAADCHLGKDFWGTMAADIRADYEYKTLEASGKLNFMEQIALFCESQA